VGEIDPHPNLLLFYGRTSFAPQRNFGDYGLNL
jgi:hypothetical protein